MKPLDGTGQKRLHRDWRRQTSADVALLLDSVQTPYNVGSILRTAAAYRVAHIWSAGATESARHLKTNKTALGSARYLDITEGLTIEESLEAIEASPYRLVGVELAPNAVPIHEADLSGPVCLALGHEDRGLSATCLDACDTVVYVPQLGKIGSLNVAVAASIALYELHRQGWQPAQSPPEGTLNLPPEA